MKNKVFNEAVSLISNIPYVTEVQRIGKHVTTNVIEFMYGGNRYYIESSQERNHKAADSEYPYITVIHVIGGGMDNRYEFKGYYTDIELSRIICNCVVKSIKKLEA